MVSSTPDIVRRVLRREQAIIVAGLALLCALAWLFLLGGAGMEEQSGMAAMAPPPFAALALMWAVMMVAMMLPSAMPAILLYERVRQNRSSDATIAPTWIFATGYLLVWLLFALIAAGAQLVAVGSSVMLDQHAAAAAVLIAAGVYQLSPFKGACLSECRSPAQFLSRYWRRGAGGTIRLGLLHGVYCVACCWLLMALLFVVGVMNLLWVVTLTALIASEKLLPRGAALGRGAGIALIVWGLVRLAAG